MRSRIQKTTHTRTHSRPEIFAFNMFWRCETIFSPYSSRHGVRVIVVSIVMIFVDLDSRLFAPSVGFYLRAMLADVLGNLLKRDLCQYRTRAGRRAYALMIDSLLLCILSSCVNNKGNESWFYVITQLMCLRHC